MKLKINNWNDNKMTQHNQYNNINKTRDIKRLAHYPKAQISSAQN